MENRHEIISQYYALHRNELLLMAEKRSSDRAEAEDMVQDTFVRLLTTDKMLNSTTLPALVYSVLRNIANDRWRRRKCAERYDAAYMEELETSNGFTHYSAKETRQLLERRMARLDNKSCLIMRMNVLEGRKVAEIADLMQMKYKTVECRLYHARKEIRSYMSSVLSLSI